ncbi:MAG: hypothetical protein IKV86_01120 [Clostridia bacterium]|nr:hypothetical protein [Clostridia bacterium]
MKKIISLVLVFTVVLSFCTFSVSAETNDAVRLDVEYDKATRLLTFSGHVISDDALGSATFYLLNPGKIQQDIKNHSKDNPVIANYGEFEIAVDGTFSYTLKAPETTGIYTLYFQAAGIHVTRQIDTSADILSDGGLLSELHALPTEYPASKGTTVKELYEEKREQFPDEMPVVQLADTKGLKSVYIDVTNGSDKAGTGSINAPYQTVNYALSKVPPKSGIAYVLREGTYPISDKITLSKVVADPKAPVIITNYEDEEVTFVGGTKIDSSSFGKVTDPDVIQKLDPAIVDKIVVVDLKNDYGITSFEKITTSSQPVLFVGESKYQIARWPNYETTPMKKYTGPDAENGVIDSGYYDIAVGSACGTGYRKYSKRATELNEAAGKVVSTDRGIQFCIEDLRPFSWEDTGDIWVYGKFYDDWTLNHLNITEFHPENGSIRTATGLNWGCQYVTPRSNGYQNTFYYYNVIEELDIPGEWFLDKETGKLYVYPTADFNTADIVYAQASNDIITISNSQNIVINGINFEYSRGRAINGSTDTNENILIQNCSFENLGSGVTLYGKYSGVIHSKFKNLDGKGATIQGTNDNDLRNVIPCYSFVQNSVFYNTRGISLYGVTPIASHNFVSNNVGTCIYVAANEAIVEYNEIVAGPMVVMDAGAIYVNGNGLHRRGTHVRYNYIHDAPTNTMTIYFDDMSVESYAYGNIMKNCGKMLYHNAIEMVADNNLYIDIPSVDDSNKALVPFTNSHGYYSQSNSGGVRWRVGTLEMGSFTSRLNKNSSSYIDPFEGTYAERYPLLGKWAELMYQRLDEYNALVAGGMDKTVAAKTCNIQTSYTNPANKKPYNLNQYLAACRDNVYMNNVFINTELPTVGVDNSESYINTIWQKNLTWTASKNPFKNYDFSDESAYDKIRVYVPDFDTIPFDRIGLLDEADYTINAKTEAVNPVNTTETAVLMQDLTLQWKTVDGAQQYYVELSRNESFTDIIEVATTYELSHKVISSLDADKVYYWRVTTIPKAICSTGSQLISDTFKFKTLENTETVERNQVGVTSYSVDDMTSDNFKVTTYVYNLNDDLESARFYVACYDENNSLINVSSKIIHIAGKTIAGEYVFDLYAPNTKIIKFFVWDADDNMVPYTYVKTIK